MHITDINRVLPVFYSITLALTTMAVAPHFVSDPIDLDPVELDLVAEYPVVDTYPKNPDIDVIHLMFNSGAALEYRHADDKKQNDKK